MKRKISSTVWNQFHQIFDTKIDSDIEGWYLCTLCNEPVENKFSGSTTLFHRHNKNCAGKNGQRKIGTFFNFPEKTKVSQKHITQLKEASVQYICDDLRPYSAVEGSGLFKLICTGVELAKSYPMITPEDIARILPSRRSVQRYTESKVKDVKEIMSKKIHQALAEADGFSCTADLWTDNYRQKCYLGMTAHLNRIDTLGIVHDRLIIGFREIQEETKSKEVILNHIFQILAEYNLTERQVVEKVNFVTDRGSQFKAMHEIQRSNCQAHMINNIIKAMCADSTVQCIIKDTKSLVTYIKRTQLNFRHNIVVQSYCDTRWNTVYIMVQSVLDSYQSIFDALEKRHSSGKPRHKHCLDRIECIKKSTLMKIANFLKPFKIWTDRIEADKVETIQQVWPTLIQIENHLSIDITEIEMDEDFSLIEGMKALGRLYISNIRSDIQPNDYQRMAVVLHPQMKKMRRMNTNDRESAYILVNEFVLNSEQSNMQTAKNTESGKNEKDVQSMEYFIDTEDEDTNIPTMYSKELATYLNDRVIDKNFNSRTWWFLNRNRYPNLFKLFLKISATPASSAPAERTFSTSGFIISDRRSSLLPKSVENILLVRNIYH